MALGGWLGAFGLAALGLGALGLGALGLTGCSSDGRPPRLVDGSDEAPAGGAHGGGSGGAGAAATGPGGGGLSAAGGASAGSGAAAGSRTDTGGAGAGDVPEDESCIPRQGCQRLCSVLGTDAACGLGNVRQCGCACEKRFNGPCPEELDALLACAGDAPSIDCRERGRIFPGCEDESFALEVCDFQAREQLCAGSYPDCTPYCRGAMLAFCSLGPESVSSCLCGCEATLVTNCSSEFDAFMTCTTKAPVFACAPDGRVTATSCAGEWLALDGCMTAAPSTAN